MCSYLSQYPEGGNAVAVIGRQLIGYDAPFEVTVSLERFTGPLAPDEAAVGDFGMNFYYWPHQQFSHVG